MPVESAATTHMCGILARLHGFHEKCISVFEPLFQTKPHNNPSIQPRFTGYSTDSLNGY